MVRFFSTLYVFLLHGFLCDDAGEVSVSVTEGDSVTLHTGIKENQQDRIRWYFNGIRIAQINGDLSKTCTDVQCNEGTERFRDRLKLDHQTGSLTIMNITNTDSGLYQLEILSNSSISKHIFSVSVRGVYAVETNEMKMNSVKEGKNITLDTGVIIDRNDLLMWYFNDIRLAYITGGPEIWKSPRSFSSRLQLNYQTGSLNITNIKTTDSGLYKLEITNSSCNNPLLSISSSRVKRFHVSVNGVSDSGLSSAAVAGICVAAVAAAVVLLVAGALIYHRCRTSTYGQANNNEVNHDRDATNYQIQMEASREERNETGSGNDTSLNRHSDE
ncbi:uncharacterized protein LOC131529659 [Onychostoma macrolepis]|uniref:Immunoglobulin domain-containing protein n=1 Tax=Onychostoma macrolepis TaxID=369639 RepID=A0A7J6BR89_9TELE|nr:uncharacterized protein LOC131529659 [Onychostoma macrolepis]KAF4097231.1 hypothetical protein G5714_021239 [Onychostoma macrolepis]